MYSFISLLANKISRNFAQSRLLRNGARYCFNIQGNTFRVRKSLRQKISGAWTPARQVRMERALNRANTSPPLQVEFMGLQSMARLQASGNLLAVALVVPDAVNLGDIARRNKAVDA